MSDLYNKHKDEIDAFLRSRGIDPDELIASIYSHFGQIPTPRLFGNCAFCSKYTELVTTTCDDLVCQDCKDGFEAALQEGDSHA